MTEQRRIRHEIRNYFNALNLNAACLKICEPPEAIECIESIIVASDSLSELLDQFEALPHLDD